MKKYFFTGLVMLLPFVVTVLFVKLLIGLLTKPFFGITQNFLRYYHLDHGIPYLSGDQVIRFGSEAISLAIFLLLVIVLGLVGRWFIFHYVFGLADSALHRIPLINKIYKACQDVVHSVFNQERTQFGLVVLVPFPQSNSLSIGLILQQKDLEQSTHGGLVSVFVPATPNPTMGFLLLFKREHLIFLDMSVEEALKSIVSCGVMIPDFKTKECPIQPKTFHDSKFP